MRGEGEIGGSRITESVFEEEIEEEERDHHIRLQQWKLRVVRR